MTVASLLTESAKIGGVRTVAIVDDAYDPPKPNEIDENSFNILYTDITDNNEILDELTTRGIITGDDLNDYESFLENENLITTLWEISIGSHNSVNFSSGCKETLAKLFENVAIDRHSKLTQIKPLETILENINVKFLRFGSSPDPNKVATVDVVFLDLYLSEDIPPEIDPIKKIPRNLYDKARDRAIGYAKDVRSITDNNAMAVAPAFILISSLGSDHKAKAFLAETGQMKSRFRFVSKQALKDAQPDAILAIDDIFRTRKACSIIEPIQKSWPEISKTILTWINDRLIELDITDFGHLYHLQLQKEGQPITDYVKELISGAVAERICYLFDELNLSKFEQEEGKPFDGGVPKFFDPPSNGFAELYSMTQISQNLGHRGKNESHPQSGDIFLKGKISTRESGTMGKEVFSVMSPACDLIDRGDGKSPKAKSALLLKGSINKLMFNPKSQDTHPKVIRINKKYFEIAWDIKDPASIEIKDLISNWRKGRITWLGRLKGEHFHSLQTHLLTDLGRVGLMKAPSIYERLAGDIHIKNGTTCLKLGNSFSESRGFAYRYSDQISFSGSFVNYFIDILKKNNNIGGLNGPSKKNINNILENNTALLSFIEMKEPKNHKLNGILTVKQTESKKDTVSINNNGELLIRLFQDNK